MTIDNDWLYERDEDHSHIMDVDDACRGALNFDDGMLTFFIRVLQLINCF